MNNYEPELMYALDSKDKYSDWKNVYNVSGDDICYCPICLGRVKLWNGQNPDKIYKKQKCFHHIDGMCSQENRIHFAYKTWLLEPHSKFKVDSNTYEVSFTEIEKTLNTSYGNYRPDILVKTTCGKTFYVEIADSNKKTDDYILKWDELGNDVIEIDVNKQIGSVVEGAIPIFNLIYSSKTGKCYIKHYIRQDYDELITERKVYWKRQDLINYKVKWEKLDWFWRDLQDYYLGNSTLDKVCESFTSIDFEDQKFICTRFKSGKHKEICYELEKFYNNEYELEKVRLKSISRAIQKLNKTFGYSTTKGKPYLARNGYIITFYPYSSYEENKNFYLKNNNTENEVYDYFYQIMKSYYNDKLEEQNKIKEERKKEEKVMNNVRETNKVYEIMISDIQNIINNSANNAWRMTYYLTKPLKEKDEWAYTLNFKLMNTWSSIFTLTISELNSNKSSVKQYIKEQIIKCMNKLFCEALNGTRHPFVDTFRLMEVKSNE